MTSAYLETETILGQFNRLQVIKHTNFGLYLWDAHYGDILLPNRYIPKDKPTEVDDWLDVFIYLDSDDRVIATTQIPKAQVGQFADLQVVAINKVGIFFDWGLPKDLLMPYSEEKEELQVGDYCIVYIYLDPRFGRITATAKLDRYLDLKKAPYKIGDAIDFLVANRTDMGFKVIINNEYWGLVHNNELFKPLKIGMMEQGYIKEIRTDGKISISLQPITPEAKFSLENNIMKNLEAHNGVLLISDKSTPTEIAKMFNVSKSNFKKALGSLYKQGFIQIHDDKILKN